MQCIIYPEMIKKETRQLCYYQAASNILGLRNQNKSTVYIIFTTTVLI